ncbi:unnamed protein product [Sympodiomycopsis kandeliae]
MAKFDSKPWPSGSSSPSASSSTSRKTIQTLLPSIRRRPFLLFGLPFTMTILGAAYGLSYLTETRYEYNATKVQSLSKETELGMKKDRRRVDLREEYWRLATGQGSSNKEWDEDVAILNADSNVGPGPSNKKTKSSKSKQKTDSWGDDWEPKRIARPEGTDEWGMPSNNYGASYVEEANNMRDYQRKSSNKIHAEAALTTPVYDMSKAGPPDARGNRILILDSGKRVVLGPDGKPCRACNSKLAFAEAMRGGGGSTATTKKTSPMAGLGAAAAAGTTTTSTPASPCPPDVEELGSQSWTLIHSISANYPDAPSEIQKQALTQFWNALPILYPCSYCAEALSQEYKQDDLQNATKDRDSATKFACNVHNAVNTRLGKPVWDCEDLQRLKRRWLDGGERCQ